MKPNRIVFQLNNLLYTVLLLALVAMLSWLTVRYDRTVDWTRGERNTLTETSRQLLDQLQGAINITVFARQDRAVRDPIRALLSRYQRSKKDLTVRFVDPLTHPDQVLQQGITVDGELLIHYRRRTEKVVIADENQITNALHRLARDKERWIVSLSGHAERRFDGRANHDLSEFDALLKQKGFDTLTLNSTSTSAIPDNSAVLVIASPRFQLLPDEIAMIEQYIADGGNLLWLQEPGDLYGLAPIARQLGIRFLPGTVVAESSRSFGINDPTFTVVADYPPHPLTKHFSVTTLFPVAAAISSQNGPFLATPLLVTSDHAWNETGPISGTIQHDPASDEQQGPLNIALALTRTVEKSDGSEIGQRIVVIGDGDFLANQYLGNGGNRALGLALIEWLSHDDRMITVQSPAAPDLTLQLSRLATAVIGFGFLLVLPSLLIATGWLIRYRRRRG